MTHFWYCIFILLIHVQQDLCPHIPSYHNPSYSVIPNSFYICILHMYVFRKLQHYLYILLFQKSLYCQLLFFIFAHTSALLSHPHCIQSLPVLLFFSPCYIIASYIPTTEITIQWLLTSLLNSLYIRLLPEYCAIIMGLIFF